MIHYSCRKSAEAQPNAAPFFIEKRSQEHRQWSSFVAAGDGGLSPYGMNPRPEAFWWRERQQIPFDCGQGRLSVVPTELYAHSDLAAEGQPSSLKPGNAEEQRYSQAFSTSALLTGFS